MSTRNIMMGHSLRERMYLLNKKLDLRETQIVIIQIMEKWMIQTSNRPITVQSENYYYRVLQRTMGMNMLSILSIVSTKGGYISGLQMGVFEALSVKAHVRPSLSELYTLWYEV